MNEIKETKSELKDIRSEQEETRKKLDNHIEKGEEDKADGYRSHVLRFNNELVRGLGHTEEDFDDILDVRPIPTTRTTRCPSPSRTWGAYMTKCYALMVF